MDKAELTKTLSDWACSNVKGIDARAQIVEAEAKATKTEEERINALCELSRLAGFAEAMVSLQHKLLNELKKIEEN